MSEAVQAGALQSIISMFSQLFGNGLNWMQKSDLTIKESKKELDDQNNVTGYLFTVETAEDSEGNSHDIRLKILQVPNMKKHFDVYLLSEDGKKKSYPHVAEKDIKTSVIDFIENELKLSVSIENTRMSDTEDFEVDDSFEGSTSEDDIEESEILNSKKIGVSVSKITASNELVYERVYANYDASQVCEDLEAVMSSEEIFSVLPENEEVCLEIVPMESEYDVEFVDTLKPFQMTQAIVEAQLTAIAALQIRFNDATDMESQLYKSECLHMLNDQLLFILSSKLSVEVDMKAAWERVNLDQFGDSQSCIEAYCTTLDLYKVNYPDEIQQLFNEWLLTLRY